MFSRPATVRSYKVTVLAKIKQFFFKWSARTFTAEAIYISLVGAQDTLDVFTPTQAAAEALGGDLAQTHQLVVLDRHWLCLGKKEKQHYLLLTRQCFHFCIITRYRLKPDISCLTRSVTIRHRASMPKIAPLTYTSPFSSWKEKNKRTTTKKKKKPPPSPTTKKIFKFVFSLARVLSQLSYYICNI